MQRYLVRLFPEPMPRSLILISVSVKLFPQTAQVFSDIYPYYTHVSTMKTVGIKSNIIKTRRERII
jgi:hypothetical protein